MRILHLGFVVFFAVVCCRSIAAASGAESTTWRQFVEAKKNGAEPILPDFSYAGYHGGVDAIPDIKGPLFDVTKYGAKGDGKADDQEAIQKAIDAAEAAGGGVVFFPPGTYRVNADVKHRRPLRVRKGNIVLRGSGATKGGTVLFIDEPTVKVKSGDAEGGEAEPGWMVQIQPEPAGSDERLATVTGDCPREGFSFTVDDASKIKPGMWVTLNVRGTAIVPDVIAPYKVSDMPKEWTRIHSGGLYFKENHLVKAVEGSRVTLREPVKTAVKARHGWYLAAYPPIAEVGVEDLCFMGAWLGKFIHHRSYMDDNGWSALKMQNVVDSWVRRCAFINLNEHMGFDSCDYTSVLQNVLAGTMGHVSIGTPRRCTGMLFGLALDRMEQQTKDTTHGVGAAGSAVGNVYWRYTMQPDQSFDMHGNFPYATLFDSVGDARPSRPRRRKASCRQRIARQGGRAGIALRGAAGAALWGETPRLGRKGQAGLGRHAEEPAGVPARRGQHALGGPQAAGNDPVDSGHAHAQRTLRQRKPA